MKLKLKFVANLKKLGIIKLIRYGYYSTLSWYRFCLTFIRSYFDLLLTWYSICIIWLACIEIALSKAVHQDDDFLTYFYTLKTLLDAGLDIHTCMNVITPFVCLDKKRDLIELLSKWKQTSLVIQDRDSYIFCLIYLT